MKIRKSYFDMIDAVNEAKSEYEYSIYRAQLNGFIACAKHYKIRLPSVLESDLHSKGKYGSEAEMCAGVLINPPFLQRQAD